jgi:hypothetical protein
MTEKGFLPILFIIIIVTLSASIIGGGVLYKNTFSSKTIHPIPSPASNFVLQKVSITPLPATNSAFTLSKEGKPTPAPLHTASPTPTLRPTPAATATPNPSQIPVLALEKLETKGLQPVSGFNAPSNYKGYKYKYITVYTNQSESEAQNLIQFIIAFKNYFSKNYFSVPDADLTVYLYNNPSEFDSNQQCESDFGCYYYNQQLIITFTDSGTGTYAHELVHHFDHLVIKNSPDWFVEGLPTFFEKLFGYYDDNGEAKLLLGFSNPWREGELVNLLDDGNLQKPTLQQVAQHKSLKHIERLLSLYLYQRGWLQKYAQKVASSTTKDNDAKLIVEVSGKSLTQLEADWSNWYDQILANALNPDSTLDLIPDSFVLPNKKAWDEWYGKNSTNPLFTGKTPS